MKRDLLGTATGSRTAPALGLLLVLTATTALAQPRSEFIKTTNSSGQTVIYLKDGDPGLPANLCCTPDSRYGRTLGAGWSAAYQYQIYHGGTPEDWFFRQAHPASFTHLLRIVGPEGAPISNAAATLYQPGFPKSGIVLETDGDGLILARLTRPRRTHRLLVEAEGYRPHSLELTGGRLISARHEVRLRPAIEAAEPVVDRWVPDQRSDPPPAALDAYRAGRKAALGGQADRAVEQLALAAARWPLAGGEVKVEGRRETYRPYLHLAAALLLQGDETEAESLLAVALSSDRPPLDGSERELVASLEQSLAR